MPQSSGVGNIGLAPFAIEELDLARAMEEGEAVKISFGGSTVVAGKVVDHEDRPVQGYALRLSMEDLAIEKGASGRTFNYIEVETAEDGSFRFAGPSGNTRFGYSLSSRSAGLTLLGFREEIPFDLGEEDLVLTVPGSGRLAGRVLLDDMEWSKNLVVLARFAPDADGNLRGSTEAPLEYPNGRFELDHVPAEIVELEMRQSRGSEVLSKLVLSEITTERVDGVEHLPDWDLRGTLHRHEIQLRTLDEETLQSVTGVPGFGTLSRKFFPDDRLTLLSTRSELDLEIWSCGADCRCIWTCPLAWNCLPDRDGC